MIFSHSWEEILGGQANAGFVLTGFYDDAWPDKALSIHLPGMSSLSLENRWHCPNHTLHRSLNLIRMKIKNPD